MRASDLGLSQESTDCIVRYGAETLYEPQAAAVEAGLLEGKSVLVAAPTASGKSLVAMLAMLAMLEGGGRRAVYLSPLRALVSEKRAEFSAMGKALSRTVKVSASTGDLNARDRLVGNVMCMTNERMDLALRKGESWLEEVDLVIADEIHMVGDPFRGPTLEMVLTLLNDGNRQMVGLSATISNAPEIARWLGCRLVSSTWRPVKLTEGVYDGSRVEMADGTGFEVRSSSRGAAVDLALDSISKGGQALIFVNTRKGAPSQAGKAAAAVSRMLGPDHKKQLQAISGKVLKNGENTGLADELATLIGKGVAFHHAGLNEKCRRLVEDGFRSGHIRTLAATPTLAAGVNLPARRVVIASLGRYDGRYGRNMPISVMEYKQFCGRAGRPQYDDIGEAIAVAEGDPREAMERYVLGEPERVESALHHRLGVHALSLIVAEPGITADALQRFFDGTLGGAQMGRMEMTWPLRDLERLGMVETYGKRYSATRLGEITNRLYLDPETAVRFLEVAESATGGQHTLTFLHEVMSCSEFFPVLPLRAAQRDAAYELVERYGDQAVWYVDPEDVSRSLLGLFGWINEESEQVISERYGVESGDTHRAVESARWLLRSMADIATYARLPDVRKELETLRARVVYGVREELVPLVPIRDVGRVRARALYRAGARSPSDVAAMPLDRIRSVCRVGPAAARRIRSGR